MIYVLYFIHVLISLFLILVVLLQQGSGADLSVFGGGATQAAFGARGAATLLHKLTVGGFIAFILTTIGIGFLESSAGSGSVMQDAAQEAPAPEEAIPPPASEGVVDSFDQEAPAQAPDGAGQTPDGEPAQPENDGGASGGASQGGG